MTSGGHPGSRRSSDPPISLIGLRCSGKTTVGRLLAAHLARPFADLDDALAERWWRSHPPDPAGGPAPPAGDVLRRVGPAVFRDLEERALADLLDAARPRPGVIATGGGCVERPANRALLRESTRCVWLRAPVQVLQARLDGDATDRPPLLGGDARAELEELERRRAAFYSETAELVVDGAAGTPEEIVRSLIRLLFD